MHESKSKSWCVHFQQDSSVWLLFYEENIRFRNKQPRFQSESVSPQSYLTLCAPMDCSPPGSSVHGILQTRILEWVTSLLHVNLPDPGIKPRSPALQSDSLPSELPEKLSRFKTSTKEFLCLAESQNLTFLLLRMSYLCTLFYEMETFLKQLI